MNCHLWKQINNIHLHWTWTSGFWQLVLQNFPSQGRNLSPPLVFLTHEVQRYDGVGDPSRSPCTGDYSAPCRSLHSPGYAAQYLPPLSWLFFWFYEAVLSWQCDIIFQVTLEPQGAWDNKAPQWCSTQLWLLLFTCRYVSSISNLYWDKHRLLAACHPDCWRSP